MTSSAVLERLAQAVIQGEGEDARRLVVEALEAGIDRSVILESGLSEAMNRIGRMWEDGEVFLPEVLLSARVFQECADALEASGHEAKAPAGRCILGTVRGDLHDLGKNIVGIMMKTAGFEVIDLGRDVPREAFIEAVRRHAPDILGMSALLTTTMGEQRAVIEWLEREGLRTCVRVMVGGAPVSQRWAEEIGADAYAANAREAVEKARQMLGVR